MRFLKFVVAIIMLSVLTQVSATAQQDSIVLDKILSKSKAFSESRPVEKVYLHMDKPYYSVADTIWFKAYLTMEQNLPSLLSKIVYVDVMSSRDSLVQSIKLPVVNSVATGNIPLNQGVYKQGNYYFKAYTLWMLNFGEEYFYSKTIPIGEAIDKQLSTHFSYKTTQTEKNQTIEAIVQFKNRDGVAIANKPVNWNVTSNFDNVSKGKGTTDANGFLKVKIEARKNEPITNGELTTDLVMSESETLSAAFKLKPAKSTHDVQFFPEGGELVAGIATKVAFKAISAAGRGIDLKGTITDASGAVITNFTSAHLGMGAFFLNAESNKTYKANITFKDGTVKSYELPKAMASGLALQVTNTDPLIAGIKILANDAYLAANKNKSVFVVGTQGGIIYYAAKTRLNAVLTNAKIPKDQFPPGIIQITLFSDTGEPVSERLIFNAQKATVSVSLKTDLTAYKPRQKVKLTVNAKNDAAAVQGDFSISVIDEQKVPYDEDNEVTILSSLLLTSDLKGYVEKPNYYFNKPDEKKAADLDLLLLTQGFRRFNFKEVLDNKLAPITISPEQDMRITGTLRDRTGMPVKRGALRLTVTGSKYAAEATTNPTGVFVFPNLEIPDSSEVVINAKYSANGSSLMILLDGKPSAPLSKNLNPAEEVMNIDSALAPYLENSAKQYSYLRTLKEVKIEGAKVKRPSHSDHPNLSGLSNISGTTIEGERFKGCNSVAQCLQSMAVGLSYYENNFYVTRDYQNGNRTPVQIFLNATPIDYFGLTGVQASEIESVEVFTKDELGTVNRLYNTNGVLVINTKVTPKGTKISMEEFRKLIPEANLLKFKPKGFSKQREFYSPKYVNAPATYNYNDLRSTIYWNSKVATDATGTLSFEFYNGDGNGTYRAVIEGVDKTGNIFRSVYRYTVKK